MTQTIPHLNQAPQKTSGLFSTFSAQGPGEYQIRFSGTACVNGTWDGAFTSNVTLNPDIGYVMRFHYRDHLGSSTVSKANTPRYDLNNPGGHPFRIKMNTAGSKILTLYEASALQTHFTPFGKTMGNVGESEPDPRYTDHEYDGESGFNYMKGRYQLPNYTTFNRPDPMRDWDWENPSSINLYQYVRNNPVMANDPTGYFELRTDELERMKEIAGPAADKVKIVEGRLDVSEFSSKDIENNEGALLLSQLSESDKVFVYKESDTVETAAGPQKNSSIANLDNEPDSRFPIGKSDFRRPPEGVDSMVVSNTENPVFDRKTKTKKVSEAATAFHELAEAYAKVEGGQQYKNTDGTGAHQTAIDREKILLEQRPNFTEYPAGGELTRIIKKKRK